MKRISTIILSFLMIIIFMLPGFAAGVSVSAESTALSLTDTSLIEVTTGGNTGMMGFKITVKYDVEKVDIISVSKGTVSTKGNFISNFGTNDGEFNVVWNNTSEVKEDGSLFVLGVKAKNHFDASKIELTCSQPDTFNEKYEDVVLNCKAISVSCKKGEEPTTQEPAQQKETAEKKSESKKALPADDTQVKDAIDIALKDSGYQKISEVESNDTDFVDKVNKNIEKISGEKSKFRNVTEARRAYNAAVEKSFLEAVNNSTAKPEQIKEAIEKAMVACSVTSLDKIDAKTLPKFLKAVEKELKAVDENIPSLTKELDDESAFKAIKKVYGGLELTNSKTDVKKEVEQNQKNKTVVIVIICTVIVLVAAVTAFILLKKKKGTKQNSKID